MITFTQGVWGYVSTPFPLGYALVSPYWTDINLWVSGQAYYREMPTRNADTEAEFAEVDRVLNTCGRVMCQFQAQWLYVVTWVNVGYYGSSAGSSIVSANNCFYPIKCFSQGLAAFDMDSKKLSQERLCTRTMRYVRQNRIISTCRLTKLS